MYAAAWTPRRGAQRGEGKDQQIQTDGRGWCWWARDQTRHEMITNQASKVKHTGAWGKWRHRQGRAAVSPPWPNRTNRVVKVIGMAASSNSSLSGSSLSSGKSSNSPQTNRHRSFALNNRNNNRMAFPLEKFLMLSFGLNQTFLSCWLVYNPRIIFISINLSHRCLSLNFLEVAAVIIQEKKTFKWMQLWRYWGKRKALHVHKDYKVVRCSQCDAWFWMLSLTLPIISTIPLLTFHLAVFCDYLWPP